eukprot:CAMPEP_0176105292 /NCGR_PEP_ID=MMETSP0120_2-20121206/52836_1 /TAXON_ID=160619 /ORGANISM="Kryptoperidinium foliaceum, Strain CCMP 1326" /LENGTH=376 /DNA_ID=CAMNT_0017439405 /DNA_START=33 /DNA_END=1163 /DNA_ORIENTATION=-
MAGMMHTVIVKNTFIDVGCDCSEDGSLNLGGGGLQSFRRQVSAPALPWARRAHAAAAAMPDGLAMQKQESASSGTGSTTSCKEHERRGECQPANTCAMATMQGDMLSGSAATPPYMQLVDTWQQGYGQKVAFMGFATGGLQGASQVGGPLTNEFRVDPALMSAGVVQASPTPMAAAAEVTTVMMRNLPLRYSQQMLIEEVARAGFSGTYDFLYLPIDTETKANKGYAFINFIDPGSAHHFRTVFEGMHMPRFKSSKVISVSPAAVQGLAANYALYSKATCREDPATRPLFLRMPATSAQRGSRKPDSRRGGKRAMGCGNSLLKVERAWHGSFAGGAAPQWTASASASFCGYCGSQVKSHHRFCQHCGAPLSEGAAR